MIKVYLFLFGVVVSAPLFASDWRTPNTSADISGFRESEVDMNGNFAGFSGKVVDVATGYQGKPVFVLEVSDERTERIVVGALLNANLSVGDAVEVFGDVIPIGPGDEKANELTDDDFMMLGLCIVNTTRDYAQAAKPTEELCNTWYLEKFPEDY